MKQNPTYLITRPRLASFLIERGADPRIVPNPYNPDRQAWEVELTPATYDAICTFYTYTLNKPIPQALRNMADFIAGKDGIE